MKKINILIAILAIVTLTISCESYDDYEKPRKNIVGFVTLNLEINNIPEGGERSRTVNLFMTDLFEEEKTFTIVAIPSLTEPATDAENFSFDTTVTFPPNTREASITVTGIDNSIETEEFFSLAVQGEGETVSGGIVTVRVRN